MSWNEIYAALESGASSTSFSGWIATATAVLYVILAARENVWCWPFGIISSVFSVVVYLESQLPFEALLNLVYVAVGIYGWWKWLQKKNAAEKKTPIIRLDLKTGILLLLAGLVGTGICGWISAHYKTSSLPWADAAIASFSIIATWMTAKKILENWLLWIAADAAAVFVYFVKGPSMYLFALLFIVYTFMAIAGYFSWKRNLKTASNG